MDNFGYGEVGVYGGGVYHFQNKAGMFARPPIPIKENTSVHSAPWTSLFDKWHEWKVRKYLWLYTSTCMLFHSYINCIY